MDPLTVLDSHPDDMTIRKACAQAVLDQIQREEPTADG